MIFLFRVLFILLFVAIVEMMLFIQVSKTIGFLPALFFLFAAGLIGLALLRLKTFSVLRRLKTEFLSGRPPGDALLDGLLVLGSGFMFVFPGLLTDFAGLLLVFPPVRIWVRKRLLFLICQWMR